MMHSLAIRVDNELLFKDGRATAIPHTRAGKFPGYINQRTGEITQYDRRLIFDSEAE